MNLISIQFFFSILADKILSVKLIQTYLKLAHYFQQMKKQKKNQAIALASPLSKKRIKVINLIRKQKIIAANRQLQNEKYLINMSQKRQKKNKQQTQKKRINCQQDDSYIMQNNSNQLGINEKMRVKFDLKRNEIFYHQCQEIQIDNPKSRPNIINRQRVLRSKNNKFQWKSQKIEAIEFSQNNLKINRLKKLSKVFQTNQPQKQIDISDWTTQNIVKDNVFQQNVSNRSKRIHEQINYNEQDSFGISKNQIEIDNPFLINRQYNKYTQKQIQIDKFNNQKQILNLNGSIDMQNNQSDQQIKKQHHFQQLKPLKKFKIFKNFEDKAKQQTNQDTQNEIKQQIRFPLKKTKIIVKSQKKNKQILDNYIKKCNQTKQLVAIALTKKSFAQDQPNYIFDSIKRIKNKKSFLSNNYITQSAPNQKADSQVQIQIDVQKALRKTKTSTKKVISYIQKTDSQTQQIENTRFSFSIPKKPKQSQTIIIRRSTRLSNQRLK